ncbi:M4 family metallopeptidase [Hymenobacter latericus]|uniref:M4 family metallopeptidase n=1 Tax=Hymenobacter sp. YIM 151858-1 TaxID=2987688 RepID=UPI002226FF41|nr:M4 family metallopeptidase [Hymenobacter sp. YIM 151858-1]UYZ58129.1 M4 family metallopeptidase [Hymenobacter sp. YIM 151858-1]
MLYKYSALGLALLGSAAAMAQTGPRPTGRINAADGMPELVHFSAAGARYQDARAALRATLPLTSHDEMRVARLETDGAGIKHERFQQYFKGVKVENATYTAHSRNGEVEVISGDFEQLPTTLEVRPAVSAEAALQSAMRYVRARRYMWQMPNEAEFARESEGKSTFKPSGELVIMRNTLSMDAAKAGQPTLAWKLDVYAAEPVSRAHIYVDAQTGEVISQNDIIKHAATTASFATAYSGTRSLANESYTTSTGATAYRLRSYTRGLGIETYNCRKGNSYTSAVDFTDADNSWTEYNNANFDNVAGDAHFGAQATYDYWKNVHGRNSYDNAGAKIKSYIHFDDTPGDGVGYENAYWNGSVMTYGDGATRFRPLTSLDVCAHEIGHAVCEKTANLVYSNESGAMNEGFSDIWGACIEAYAVGTLGATSSGVKAKSTWLIGEEIDKQRAALRSMSDPNSQSQPDTYKGTYWYTGTGDNGGVHTNSGVLNHWFYRLAVGGSGTNDIGSAFNVTGIGIDAAAKIAYRTESVYLTSSSTYASARTYSIQAAKDLYGAGSAQEIAVTNAWYAVGVGAAYGGGSTTPPPTTVTYCASKGSTTYEWIDLVQLGSINRTSGANGGYYDGTALSTSVAAGSSQTIYFSAGFASTAYTEYWKVYIDYNKNGVFTDAGELVVSGSSSSTGTLSASFTVPTTAKSGATRLRVVMSDNSATTSCNTYSYGETEDYTVNITGGTAIAATTVASLTGTEALGNEEARTARVFPNPANDFLNIALPGNMAVQSVQVFDARGAEVQVRVLERGQLDVSNLRAGIYQLSISDGQKAFRSRFVKQ